MGLSLISETVVLVLKLFYVVFLSISAISFYIYRTDKLHVWFLLILPIVLPFSSVPYKVLALAILLPTLFFKVDITKAKIGLTLLYIVFILLGLLAYSFGDFGKITVKSQKYSANEQYRIDLVDSDQGALGGDTYVSLYRVYFNLFQIHERDLYDGPWDQNPEINWLDDENVIIEDKHINIFKSEIWNTKK